MKKVVFFLLMLVTAGANAQTDITNSVVAAVKTGNVEELSKYFADNIDLAVQDTDDIVSKAQAKQILKKFFDGCAAQDFVIKHQGKSQLGIEYRIGELKAACGTFRVNINLKQVGDSYQVNQFRIENQ